MSWLLVALIPGLLMLATLGLERVESGLRRDTISPADVDEFLAHAENRDVDAPTQGGMDRTLHSDHRSRTDRDTLARGFIESISAPGLPTREYLQHLANTEFQQTRHANHV